MVANTGADVTRDDGVYCDRRAENAAETILQEADIPSSVVVVDLRAKRTFDQEDTEAFLAGLLTGAQDRWNDNVLIGVGDGILAHYHVAPDPVAQLWRQRQQRAFLARLSVLLGAPISIALTYNVVPRYRTEMCHLRGRGLTKADLPSNEQM